LESHFKRKRNYSDNRHKISIPNDWRGLSKNDVTTERRLHDVVVGEFGVPQTEAVVVLGGQHHIFHARRFGDGDPLVGVEFDRVELLVERIVFVDRKLRGAPRITNLTGRDAGRPQWMNMPKRKSFQASMASARAGVSGSAVVALHTQGTIAAVKTRYLNILLIIFIYDI
jgi:hypothetical protein